MKSALDINNDVLKKSPVNTSVTRIDELKAARNLILTWNKNEKTLNKV